MVINTLVKEQMGLGEMLNKLLAGILREGSSRRTAEFITKKRIVATQYWDEFKLKHEEIEKIDLQRQHEYFRNNLYQQAEERYNAIVKQLDFYTSEIMKSSTAVDSNGGQGPSNQHRSKKTASNTAEYEHVETSSTSASIVTAVTADTSSGSTRNAEIFTTMVNTSMATSAISTNRTTTSLNTNTQTTWAVAGEENRPLVYMATNEQVAEQFLNDSVTMSRRYPNDHDIDNGIRNGSITSFRDDVLRNAGNNEYPTLNIRRYDYKITAIRRMINEIKNNINTEQSSLYAEYKRIQITNLWSEITQIHEELSLDVGMIPYQLIEIEETYMNLELQYEEIMLKLLQKHRQGNGNEQDHRRSLVPRPNLPTFEGEFQKWSTFHDMYTRVVHCNNSLSAVEKMQLLKTHLRGEAARPIHHLTITEANYESAWKIICDRYDNKRIIFSVQMDTLLNQPAIQSESAGALKQLYDSTKESLYAINNLGIETISWGPMVVHILERKLDKESRKLYEQSLKEPKKITTLDEILSFLETRFQSLDASRDTIKDTNRRYEKDNRNQSRQTNTTSNQCKFCKENHQIYNCKKFQQLSNIDRLKFVNQRKLCVNCINHDADSKCQSKYTCGICKKAHHTSLHINGHKGNKKGNANTSNNERQTQDNTNENRIANHMSNQNISVVLATATVRVKTAFGSHELFRVLLDQGSQASFITESAAQILALPKTKVLAEITGLGQTKTATARAKLLIEVKPNFPAAEIIKCEAFVIPKITKSLPNEPITGVELDEEVKRNLADWKFDQPGPIDIILGAEVCSQILMDGVKKTPCGLVAQRTTFGWILSGVSSNRNTPHVEVINLNSLVEINDAISKLWELQEDKIEKTISEDDKICEQHFLETHTKKSDGSYMVRIPFKDVEPDLGESRKTAVARLLQLEKRFKKDPELANKYKLFIEEYLRLNHMKPVARHDLKRVENYYLPHQPVVKNDSTTTKLRVVFDASSRSSNGKCLNDTMWIGPRLQPELTHILLRWRLHRIVFTVDIEKMYRCVELDPRDQHYHRILWRFNDDQPIREYQLTTVTYGTSAAPYLAVRAVQQLAKDKEEKYKIGSKIALKDFYVDDLMSGAEDVKTAKMIQKELIEMLKEGNFNLRKWTSNNDAVIAEIPKALREKEEIEIEPTDRVKTLGMHWYPLEDKFQFKLKISDSSKSTKRMILSDLARIFDPIGLISPITITAKIILQEIWISGCEWDKEPAPEILEKWKKFKSNLYETEKINIPRWINYTIDSSVELHGFCDSSEKAYAAAIYMKILRDGETCTNLITSKARVAPIKMKKTLPRLELCGAALLAKNLHQLQQILSLENVKIFAWTDSMITLAWIKGGPNKWKSFVSTKVAEINAVTQQDCWRYVPSKENPADVASRGASPKNLKDCKLWWFGPKWLNDQAEKWPEKVNIENTSVELKRKEIVVLQNTISTKENELLNILTKLSSINKIVRVAAWCLRLVANIRKKKIMQNIETSKYITASEIKDVLTKIVILIQELNFASEIKDMKNKVNISKKSKIELLDPFMDETGLIRVGGRLCNSQLPFEEKHPIILPPHEKFTELLIKDAHERVLHSGFQGTYGYIRRKYWIISARKEVKKVINKCIVCFRYKKQSALQKMGNLPAARVNPSHTFQHTGVDYAGPLKVRISKGRGNKSYKGYIAVFVCLATKAIHIEIVSDMTTESFNAAFNRFNSRRGPCYHIYSDNGTNFIGARKVLDADLKRAIKQNADAAEELSNAGVTWHFIPPGAPHFGGIWEAGVKSIKYHLSRIVGESTLTYEELSTVVCKIEGVLNSRPLCELSSDPTDFAVITPAHFLTGRALTYPPQAESNYDNEKPSSRWKLVQKIATDFWKIWSKEYLNRLQQRTKWSKEHVNIKNGDLVLLKDEDNMPAKWPLARVIDTHPGDDGIVRVVTIKTKQTIYKRPITKVCKLPFDPNEYDQNTGKNGIVKAGSHHTKIKVKRANGRNTNRAEIWFNMLLLVGIILNPVKANFTIMKIDPGIYIEQLGDVHINRGSLRIQVNISSEMIYRDQINVNETISRMSDFCSRAARLSTEINCENWINHLEVQAADIISIIEALRYKHRTKRGILGTMLQAVFGVNDDVYRSLDSLDQNQQILIQSAKQQSKLMISALTTANETDHKVTMKLNMFTQKLNKGLLVIEKMQNWFSIVDTNKIEINLLAAYQTSSNYLQEVHEKYNKLMNVVINTGSLLSFISFRTLDKIAAEVQAKLSSDVFVVRKPANKLQLINDGDNVIINVYLHIIEAEKYTTFKATAIPFKKGNKYRALKIIDSIISVNYNLQLYFEQDELKFKHCDRIEKHVFSCSPGLIHDLDTKPSCVIDEIYGRYDKRQCETYELSIEEIIWQQLHHHNSWMFTAGSPTVINIICDTIRKEVVLNGTGILSITRDCVMKTKINVIKSDLFEEVPIIGSFVTPINFGNYSTLFANSTNIKLIPLEKEDVFNSSETFYSQAIAKESTFENNLEDRTWKKIVMHTSFINVGITISIVLLVSCIVIAVLKRNKHRQQPTTCILSPMPNAHVSGGENV